MAFLKSKGGLIAIATLTSVATTSLARRPEALATALARAEQHAEREFRHRAKPEQPLFYG